MRTRNLLFCMLLCAALQNVLSICEAQNVAWQQTNGPQGGWVYDIAIGKTGTLFAGCHYAGIFRSSDNGASWTQVFAGGTIALAVNSSGDIFAGPGGIVRSTDDGITWISKNTGLTNTNVWSIAISPNGSIFAGTYGGGVFRSPDNGENWIQVNNGLTEDYVTALAVAPNGSVFAGTSNGVFRSIDNGASWIPTNNGMTPTYVGDLCANADGSVFSGTEGLGVFRSTDNGDNWFAVNNGLSQRIVMSLAVAANGTMFAGGMDGVFHSSDNGGTWTLGSSGMTNTITYALKVSPNGEVFAGTWGGIFKSTDNGSSWDGLHLIATYIGSMATLPNGHVFAGVYLDGVARTTDLGATWTRVSSGITQLAVEALYASKGGPLFVGTQNGVFRSTNEGAMWEKKSAGMPSFLFLYRFAENGQGALFAGGNIYVNGDYTAAVYKSSDNGDNWALTNTGLDNFYLVRSLAVDDQGVIYAGGMTRTWSGFVARSTDDGQSWISLKNDFSGPINSIVLSKTGCVFAGSVYSGVYRSTDGGSTWADPPTPQLSGVYSLAINSIGHVFAGSLSGVYRSTDLGTSWAQFGSGLGRGIVLSLAINSDGFLFAGTYDHGVYRSVESTVPQFTITATAGTGGSITPSGPVKVIQGRDQLFTITPKQQYENADVAVDGISVGAQATYTFVNVTGDHTITASFKKRIIDVAIDVKPGSTPNPVNPKTKGVIPVAILTTNTFNALTVDPLTVRFGPGNAVESHGKGHPEDVDGDGDVDLMLHFDLQASGIKVGDASVSLTGKTLSGQEIMGSDAIVTVGAGAKNMAQGEVEALTEELYGIPTTTKLLGNYPNPFNPSTTIRYQLSEAGQISLSVYNTLGEEVASLVCAYQQPGIYQIQWNPQLPSGVFLCRFQKGAYVQTTKLILLK